MFVSSSLLFVYTATGRNEDEVSVVSKSSYVEAVLPRQARVEIQSPRRNRADLWMCDLRAAWEGNRGGRTYRASVSTCASKRAVTERRRSPEVSIAYLSCAITRPVVSTAISFSSVTSPLFSNHQSSNFLASYQDGGFCERTWRSEITSSKVRSILRSVYRLLIEVV